MIGCLYVIKIDVYGILILGKSCLWLELAWSSNLHESVDINLFVQIFYILFFRRCTS